MNITKFIIFTFAGSLVWSITLSLAGYYGGKAWSQISERTYSIFGVVGAVIIAGIIVTIIIMWLKGRHSAH
jgi:membrane protein DedA with SNARE-associated domain